MRYIFVTGAPGSRWSGYVEDHLYVRDDVDTSDFRQDREYKVDGKIHHIDTPSSMQVVGSNNLHTQASCWIQVDTFILL